ncbi:hypothetical protein AB3S75_020450 [Citrus x aurantiifolia]
MKVLSWNVRGLGKPRTRQALKKVLHLHKPEIFFCCETKMLAKQVYVESRNFNFEYCFAVDRDGMGGGLALFWNAKDNVEIKSFSKHHIDALVHNDSGKVWRCTGVYGHPETSQRHHTLTLLKSLAGTFSLLWYCFGDFNEVLYLHEKSGGRDRNLNLVSSFREAVEACNLMDVGYSGYKYTWSNRRYDSQFIEERLDRVLCSKNWTDTFQDSTSASLVNWVSDHCPILMEVKERDKATKYEKKSFSRNYYEDMWSSYENCKNIVNKEWAVFGGRSKANLVQQFQKIAKSSLANLKIWSNS